MYCSLMITPSLQILGWSNYVHFLPNMMLKAFPQFVSFNKYFRVFMDQSLIHLCNKNICIHLILFLIDKNCIYGIQYDVLISIYMCTLFNG